MSIRLALLLILACAINVLPLYLVQVGGDIAVHLSSIHCYATQFWQGDWLPRWCFKGDGGVGSPALLFYPPFSYLVTSLLYPLRFMGASVYAVYVLAATLAVLMAAFGCWRWLKPLTGPEAALVGAVIYVFLPYHQEVLLGRSAYGELWVLAFAPFMASAARTMLQRQRKAAWWFVFWTTLALLSEPAVALCVLMGIGMMVLAQGTFSQWVNFALACAVAGALTMFYALPAMHYMPFIDMERLQHETPAFANRFVMPVEDAKNGRMLYIVGLMGTLGGFAWLCRRIWRHRGNISRMPARREVQVWSVVGVVAACLMFPISTPVWALINYISPVGFPWRMQAVLIMVVSLLSAVYARWFTRNRTRTIKGDFSMLIMLLFCFETVMIVVVPPKDLAGFRTMVASDVMALHEYRTRWTSLVSYEDQEAIAQRHKTDPSPTEILNGTVLVNVLQWGWQGIVLQVDAIGGKALVRLNQRYFPLWQITSTDGAAVEMQPEAETGYIVLAIPPGRHLIRIVLESRWHSIFGDGARQEKTKIYKQEQLVVPEGVVMLQKPIFDIAMHHEMPL